MFFSVEEPASGGAASTISFLKPSKPFLLYATLNINHIRLHSLIDTGASATCISLTALRRIPNVRYVDTTSRSFLLADGVVPLAIRGLVELYMEVGNELIPFYALVTEKLCIDLIIGMDFMIGFNANIDVKSQHFSIEIAGRRTTIEVDDRLRRPLVPLHSCSETTLPPHSTVEICVSSPLSSLSAYFIPTSSFLENLSLSSSQKIVHIQQHRSSFSVSNTSDYPQYIPQHFCFGYLLSNQADLQSYFDKISVLCDRYNEKKNREVLLHASNELSLVEPGEDSSPSLNLSTICNSIPSSISSSLKHTLDLLAQPLPDSTHRSILSGILTEFSQLFDNSHHNISNIVIENVFNTVPHTPPAFRPHRNPHTQQETQRLIEEFLEAGIIQESNSPYAAPGFIVPRKDNRPGRLVIDYRALNKITIPDASPLPHGEDLLQELGKGYKYFSKLDLKSGYHQLLLPPEDRPKTAFVVSHGHYEFLVLSMGPQNAPAAFQKTMYRVLKPCRNFCQVYLDDIIIYSKTFDEHISHLRLTFEILANARLVLNASKCELAVQKVVVLSHAVTEMGLTPTDDAIQAILELSEPRTLTEANKFLGGLAYYRKFVPNFAHIAAPIHKVTNLTKATRHLFKWTEEQSQAFHELKRLLTTAPLFLRFPVDGFPLHLCTDASGVATGGVLFQDINGERRNLFYHSKVLSVIEQKYSVPEKEALAILHCLQRMRTLVLGRTVYIHTDHCPICGMLQKPVNNRRIERVANLIQEYQIAEMKHIGGKANCLADYLSRPSEDPLFDIPYGLESKLPLTATPAFDTAFPSLEGVVSTMTLRPRPKSAAQSLPQQDEFDDSASDTISCSSTDSIDTDSLPFTTTPSPNLFDSNELQREQANDPEIRRIFDQLSSNPSDQSNLSSLFLIKNNVLHRLVSLTARSTRKIAVPYLPSSMIKSLLTAMHDDPYQGGHFATDKMISKIRSRYWWPQMSKTISQHVKACAPCQQYNHSRQKKPGHLRPITPTAIPFAIIGMDFCGPFPESPQGNKYILVITDLFTRFVTAIPLPKNTAELTAFTLFRHIFCRFGVCATLITDQGTHFNNNLMKALTHLIGFNHILSTPYHPQTNGVVERFNASMVVQIAKLQQPYHNNWDDYLDAIVFAYNTSRHRSTTFSPFELLFGRAPTLPIDSPPRYFQFDRPNDHFLNLQKILQVYHQQAKANIVSHQQYTKLHYDRNRSDPHYSLGDRVFTKIFSSRGKLDPRFSLDPHIVVRANHPTYIVLHEPSGVEYQYHVSDLRPVVAASDDFSL